MFSLTQRTYPRAPTVICEAASDAMVAIKGLDKLCWQKDRVKWLDGSTTGYMGMVALR
jgi:hypothetical protein